MLFFFFGLLLFLTATGKQNDSLPGAVPGAPTTMKVVPTTFTAKLRKIRGSLEHLRITTEF